MLKRRTFKRLEADNVTRFLTFSCHRKLPLLGSAAIRDHFMSHLRLALNRHRVQPIAWVVMPDHVHLIVLPKHGDAVTSFLISLKRPFAQSVLTRWRKIDARVLTRIARPDSSHRYWQTGGGYDRLLFGNELFEKIRYCHANPIRRGLCQTSTDWAWSSARQYAGIEDAIGPKINFSLLPASDKSLI
jgi:putative transposase